MRTLTPRAGRMENPDIEQPRHLRRVTERDVLLDIPAREAAPVNRNADVIKRPRFGMPFREHVDVASVGQLVGETVARIMVAERQKHVDARLGEPLHSSRKE